MNKHSQQTKTILVLNLNQINIYQVYTIYQSHTKFLKSLDL